MQDLLLAAALGVVEGLTEFIPVSSTAHLIVLVDGLNLPTPPGHVFEVFIQLGAILAVVALYHRKLIHILLGLPHDKNAQRFAINIIVGTLPALIAGFLAHDWIKTVLYSPQVIAFTLILGALAIFWIERTFKNETIQSAEDLTPKTAFMVGCCQMIALVPGVSRSGATIMGGLMLGLSRPAATEFSFFLSIPIMCAAVAYDAYKNRESIMTFDQPELLLAGFLAAFISALFIVKIAVAFISKHGFAPFAWYRIGAGILVALVFF